MLADFGQRGSSAEDGVPMSGTASDVPYQSRQKPRPPSIITSTNPSPPPIRQGSGVGPPGAPGPTSIGAASSTRMYLVAPTPKGVARGEGRKAADMALQARTVRSSPGDQLRGLTTAPAAYDTAGLGMAQVSAPLASILSMPETAGGSLGGGVAARAGAAGGAVGSQEGSRQGARDDGSDDDEEDISLGPWAYAFYWGLLFAAFWFGSARFDIDGDGDFDIYDVRMLVEDPTILNRNFQRDRAQRPALVSSVETLNEQRQLAQQRKALQNQNSGSGELAASAASGGSGGKSGSREALQGGQQQTGARAREPHQKVLAGQAKPYFTVCSCIIPFVLFIVAAISTSIDESNSKADLANDMFGLDTAFNERTFKDLSAEEELDRERNGYEGMTDLRAYRKECEDTRWQIWRWWTYQFTHAGWPHLLVNIFLNLVFGIPLEGVHGTSRMVFMYNVGVLAGACCVFVSDVHNSVVGMSGGCYALIGMHTADLVVNWHERKFRKPTLVIIVTIVLFDTLLWYSRKDDHHTTTSYASHVGGALGGLLIGILMVKNFVVRKWEVVLNGIAAVLLPVLFIFALCWYFGNDPPRNIQQEEGWCWQRAVWKFNVFGEEWRCVRCASKACAELWGAEEWLRPISERSCDNPIYPSDSGAL